MSSKAHSLPLSGLNSQVKQSEATICTRTLIGELHACWPNMSVEQQSNFDKLVRKVDIARKLYATYETGWKKGPSSEPLDQKTIHQLAGIFLKEARHKGSDKASSLKFLNAALNTMDLLSEESEVLNHEVTILLNQFQ